jgi:SdrD B-like domain
MSGTARALRAVFGLTRGRRRWIGALVVALGASAMVITLALASNEGGFEIDANQTPPGNALYSGNEGGDDWAKGSSQEGIFIPSTSAPHTAAADLYGSNIDKNPAAVGPSVLIGDGNSDSKFNNQEPEENQVSPAGKSPDDKWPVKPGNVHAKDDFSHAYVHASTVDSPCDSDPDAEDVVLHLGGHVGDNEGSHFWGFEFMKNQPGAFANLKANDGSSFTLDFNRSIGDILVSFTVPGNSADPVLLELFRVTGFNADGSAIFTLAGPLAGCPAAKPQGFSALTSNSFNQVKAPPWNIPVCDPTTDNGANTCRLANGTTLPEDLLAERDFAEASVDLQAFGISPCFSNVVFSSRSSHPLEGADVKDVGGADFPLCGAKKGIKFHDRNADGDRDTGEETLSGWQIKLYRNPDGDGVLEDSDDGVTGNGATPVGAPATTDANGQYVFPNLQNGNYIVCEVRQSGWNQSLPNSGTADKADCSIDPSLGALGRAFTMTGPDHTGNDFGNYRNATKSGTKFVDTNGNGVRDSGEPGKSGVQIHLFGTDGLGNAVHRHPLTDANGNYSISVPPGNYTVCESVPSGWTQSFPTSGVSCAGHTGASGLGYSITLASGDVDSGNDFGNFQNGTKSGTKFEDLNANGIRDLGEPGIANVQIHLFGTDGRGNPVHNHALTDSNGAYSISAPPGSYTACETVPTGYTQSFPTSGPSCAGHTGASGIGWAVTLTSGLLDSGNDFGNFRPATISGMKFKDADAGGDKDGGEIGLGGWEIHLFGTDGSGGSVHQHTTTAANGTYSFSVKPGTYTVCETISGKPNWVQTFPSGTACTGHTHGGALTPGAAGYASVAVTSAGTAGDKDFGNTPLSRATVTFESLADLPNGSDATRATSISCRGANDPDIGSSSTNTLTTDAVKTNESSLTCTITFVDP